MTTPDPQLAELNDSRPIKAWKVMARDVDPFCVVRFASTRGQAMSAGLDELRSLGDADNFTDLRAERFPEMDGRHDDPPTLRELIEQHGWSIECRSCGKSLTCNSEHLEDHPVWQDDVTAYCRDCEERLCLRQSGAAATKRWFPRAEDFEAFVDGVIEKAEALSESDRGQA